MTKLSKGVTVCCEACGLKLVVIQACAEAECDLICCGRPVTVTSSGDPGDWEQFAKEPGAKEWQQYAQKPGSAEWEKYVQKPSAKENKKRQK